jgi:hypothetical protein
VADLVTHLATALLPGALVGRWIAPVAVGVALPDLGARVVPMGLEALQQLGAPIPDGLILSFAVLHEPIPLALVCTTLVAAVARAERRRTLLGLWGGCAVHQALDVLQDHHGQGYYLLAPFSLDRYELGLLGSEATVAWAPWLALATAAAWVGRWALRRKAGYTAEARP